MWTQTLLLALLGLAAGAEGQQRASLRRGSERGGRCQYIFTVESPAEASCPRADGSVETESIRERLSLLEALVGQMLGTELPPPAAAAADQELAQLRQERDLLDQRAVELQRQVEELTLLRERCTQAQPPQQVQPRPKPTSSDPASVFQEMKAEVSEVPAPRRFQEGVPGMSGCGELLSVEQPVTHGKADTMAGKYGVWFQDPESAGLPYGPETVWRIDAVAKDVRQLFAYEGMDELRRGFPWKVLVLPESAESTGATVFRGSLYYQRQRSRTLLRYDLASERIAARRDLPHAAFHGQQPYSWGGFTDIDLAVDERGLWVIYSTSKAKGAIVLSRLDPASLEVTRTWETNIRKNMVANAFMICGRLYTVASYSLPNTTINYVYNTDTGQSQAIAVPFHNRYLYNSMVDYNPANGKLYAWDNFHMVTYDVKASQSGAAVTHP
ncbi:myocilin-like [Denticeps clupeoides]|uniref:myocilin-like n=1 Tax=Denticeps clupeoides TaxID=299321 RepID=UPI0010A450F0|nr:myocilin-like [Denticeps clupeoides]